MLSKEGMEKFVSRFPVYEVSFFRIFFYNWGYGSSNCNAIQLALRGNQKPVRRREE
jgi:hypothetical protein